MVRGQLDVVSCSLILWEEIGYNVKKYSNSNLIIRSYKYNNLINKFVICEDMFVNTCDVLGDKKVWY